MRLRQQLLAVSIVLLMVPATVSFAGFYLLSRWAVPAMKASVQQRTRLGLDRLVQTTIEPLAADDDARLARLLAELTADPSFAWAEVVDDDGKVRAVLGHPPPAVPGAEAITSDGTVVAGRAPVEVEGLALGTVGVGYRMARAKQVETWSTILGVASALATAIGVGLSIVFARRFVRPIEEMKRYAAAVTTGDLGHRIASTDRSELGELANHLDTMTAALQEREDELIVRRRELERAVGEIRVTQDELMRSSRLAAVGEMAGRTAHEVLNPAQSLHGRLARMTEDELPTARHNAEVLAVIVDAWQQARGDGPDGLVRALAEPVGDGTALDADLDALAELARSHRAATDRTAADLLFLQRELDRITRIVDAMRTLSRQSSSVTRLALAPVLAEACEIVRDTCVKRRIDVRWSAAATIAVEVDRYELIQVLTNLLRNAMPAVEQRHGRAGGTIEIAAIAGDDRVTIDVRDDGVGIDPAHLPLIFEQRFTTRSAAEGTGLGLSISRRLVRQMGGELTLAATEIGRGTTFRIELPVAPAMTVESLVAGPDAHHHHHAA